MTWADGRRWVRCGFRGRGVVRAGAAGHEPACGRGGCG
jgi:hypothetical protein